MTICIGLFVLELSVNCSQMEQEGQERVKTQVISFHN